MNTTTRALSIKFVMTLAAAALSLWLFDGNTFGDILIFSVAATALNYLIGDLWVLPNFGNVVASIADGGMAALLAYIAAALFEGFRATFGTLVLLALLVAVGEFFFHQYLLKRSEVAPNNKQE